MLAIIQFRALESGEMSHVCQQILALDARYNNHRAPGDPSLRTLYIRRRNQLLREHGKAQATADPDIRKNYLRLRKQILCERFGGIAASECSSRSMGQRSASQLTLEEPEPPSTIVPTEEASASRKLVGDTSLAENYSFAGVHHVFEQHAGRPVSRVAFAHDERGRLGIASGDGALSLCSVGEGQDSRLVLWLRGHEAAVTDFAWSSSNDVLVSVSLDGCLRVWDAGSGECVRVIRESAAPLLACVFQPANNNLVVLGSTKGSLHVANISTGILLKSPAAKTGGAATALCTDSAGRLLWAGDDRGSVVCFKIDATSGKLAKGRKTLICQNRKISSLSSRAWMNREARDPFLLISVAANILCLYRVTGVDGALEFRAKFPLRHSSPTSGVRSAFCPLMSFRQGACVLSGSEDSCVYLFDAERERPVNKLQGHGSPVSDVAFNHDESWLASGDAAGVVIIWKRQKPAATQS